MGNEWDDAARRECARRLARSMRMSDDDAEGVAQQTMERLTASGNAGASPALVVTVARNVAIDKLRELARAKRRDGGSSDGLKVASEDPLADELADARAVFARVRARLGEMPESPRAVITRHYFEGMSFVEIVAWRAGESPRGEGESEVAHHDRCADWVHMNHTRGLRWLRERIAR